MPFPDHLVARVDAALAAHAAGRRGAAGEDVAAFDDAVAYPLAAGGKRLRSVLLLATVEALGGDVDGAMPAAVAMEWIHTFSLVHDDLPAMDDDDLRRGLPTTHVRYGEDVAVLVGDALLNGAFRLILSDLNCQPARRLAVLAALADGVDAMIAGQYLDVRPSEQPDEAWLRRMCALKTGRLIRAAVDAGLAYVGATHATATAYGAFADEIGLGFQIVDDVLDATATAGVLGKPPGSDAAHDKRTFVTVLGLERARDLAAASAGRGEALLAALPGDPTALGEIAARVYARDR